MNWRWSLWSILLLCSLITFGLGLKRLPPKHASAELKVVSSVYPLADFAKQIVQDRGQVVALVPAGVEPHEYEPTPSTVRQALQADVLIYIGGGFDAWSEDLATEVLKRGGQVVEIGDLVPLLDAVNNEEGAHAEDAHNEALDFDPHVWLDPVRSQEIVQVVTAAIQAADMEHRAEYAANAQTFIGQLQNLDLTYQQALRECGLNDIIVSHDAFQYLGQRYGFMIHSIAGLSPDNEPSLHDLAELAVEAKNLGVNTIFFETLVSPKLAQTLAEEIGAQTAVLNPIEGLSAAEAAQGDNYLSLMAANRVALANALLCR
jgi:zinc transport system substrate-binding protein